MSRPVLIDLFCRAGGASVGYQRAGFDVIGFDLHASPDYPYDFEQGDVFRRDRGGLPIGPSRVLERWLRRAVAGHGSPPCQASSALTKGTNYGRDYPQLIPATRRLFVSSGLPYVIENVQGAALIDPVKLCGEMFGLDVIRHRLFETNWSLTPPPHPKHRGRVRGWRHGVYYDGPYLAVYGDGGGKGSIAEWRDAMGIDWMTDRKDLAESIPPSYAEYVGRQLREVV